MGSIRSLLEFRTFLQEGVGLICLNIVSDQNILHAVYWATPRNSLDLPFLDASLIFSWDKKFALY